MDSERDNQPPELRKPTTPDYSIYALLAIFVIFVGISILRGG
jgi:hypothetical protein